MGRNTTAAPGTAHSRTGISISSPRTRSGRLHRHLEAHVGPERHPAHDRLVDAELVEQRHHVAGVGVHAVGRGVPGLVRPAVAGQVEQDDLEAPLGEVGGQAAAELVVEEQAVQEHEHP